MEWQIPKLSVPDFDRDIITTLRALRIRDPIERLRFLRREMGGAAAAAREPRWNQKPAARRPMFVRKWLAVSGLAGLTAFASLGFREGFPAASMRRQQPAQSLILHRSADSAEAPGTAAAVSPAGIWPAGVWLVDQKDGIETYSNGLRIEDRYAVPNTPRGLFPVYSPDLEVRRWRNTPAGIVYHTTESELAPFEPGENRALQRIGMGVLEYVRRNRSYHFLIDRFGRVFRVVRESDVAFHAGNSVWGSGDSLYIDLNHSFLGIAFEMQTRAVPGMAAANPAQIHAGRVLTQMLRAKYRIPAADCVTHAQVSINPLNQLIGYHTDWAGNFPFEELGLPDNYRQPPASLTAIGFNYDPAYVQSTGASLLPALLAAEQQLRAHAAAGNLSVAQLRSVLQNKYREIAAAAQTADAAQGEANEK